MAPASQDVGALEHLPVATAVVASEPLPLPPPSMMRPQLHWVHAALDLRLVQHPPTRAPPNPNLSGVILPHMMVAPRLDPRHAADTLAAAGRVGGRNCGGEQRSSAGVLQAYYDEMELQQSSRAHRARA